MITERKLNVYSKYKGNLDGWTRTAPGDEKAAFSSEEWSLIEGLAQDLRLVQKGLASSVFSKQSSDRLIKLCDDDKTIALLKEIGNDNTIG